MARRETPPIHLRSARLLDVAAGAYVGGPLLDVANWTRPDGTGVHVTPVARSALG